MIVEDPFERGLQGFRFWRRHELGKRLLRRWFPKYAEKREAVWAQRAARRAARQRQPDEGETFQQDEVSSMNIPENTMRKNGVNLIGLSPVIGAVVGVGLKMFGVGDECTAEAIEAGCQTADQIAASVGGAVTAIVSAVGGILFWRGQNRAHKRGE